MGMGFWTWVFDTLEKGMYNSSVQSSIHIFYLLFNIYQINFLRINLIFNTNKLIHLFILINSYILFVHIVYKNEYYF